MRTRRLIFFPTLAAQCLCVFSFVATIATRSAAQAPETSKKVLILFTHQSDNPAQAIVEEAMHSTLQSGLPAAPEIYSEYLDAVRIPLEGGYENDLVKQLQHKYKDKKFDLIFAINRPALQFLIKHRAELSPDTPIVFLVLDQQNVSDLDAEPKVTGVWSEVNYSATLDLALGVHSGTKHVFVITGVGDWDNYWRSVVQQQLQPFEDRVEISYLTGLTISEQKEALSALPPESIVLFVSSTRDKAGNNPGNLEVLKQICPFSNAPVYGTNDAQLGLGIIGGKVMSFHALGVEGAQVGLHVLKGENADLIASRGIPSVPIFDWRQLQHWGISEGRLPEGSVVQFKQVTGWDEYKWYVVGALGLLIIETFLIAFLVYMRFRRKQAVAEAESVGSRLKEIVANVPGLVWESRSLPGTNERRTTFVSDFIKTILGYSPDEWLEQPPGFGFRIVTPQDRERVERESDEVTKTGEPAVSEYRWITKEGEIRWAENHIAPIVERSGVVGLRGVVLDITARKLAEQKAREMYERNTSIVAAMPDMTFVLSPEGYYLDLHANDPTSLVMPAEDLLGKNIRDVLPPELASDIFNCFQEAAESDRPAILEYKLDLSAGERWFESRIVRSGDNFLSVVRDITNRKRTIDELRHSEERFSKAFRANPQPMSITTVAEGRYIDVNDSFLSMSGYSREEIIGRTSLEFGIWGAPERRAEFIRKVLENGSVVNTETEFHARSGEVRTLLSSAELLEIGGQECLLVASSDVTERVAAQQAIKESEGRFRNMADTAPVMIWMADENQAATYVNKPLLDFTGTTFEEQLDRAWMTRVHPDDLDECVAGYTSGYKDKKQFELECRLMRHDGEYRWVISTGTPRFSPNGEFVGYIGTAIDITERKAAEAAIAESEERFRTMAETTPVMIWVTDVDRLCTYVNKEWVNFTGRTFEQELGFGWADVIHPDDRDRTRDTYQNGFDRRIRIEYEFRVRRADGEYRWLLSTGTPRFSPSGEFLGYIGSCVDLTERKRSEEALRTALDELHQLKSQLEAENIYLQEELQQDQAFGDIVGHSAAIKYVLFKVSQVAATDSTVLIAGETGTGKELVARAIHDASPRKDRPLIRVNCAALTPSLIESELFGHEKGAFTSAVGRKMGRFELANGGTLLLDEIGELPLELQAKLLRVLQEGEFERVGGDKTINVDVRLIASTNRNLKQEVEKGNFRQDLWYRLNVFPITTPPLRERHGDIPILTDHFVRLISRKFGKNINAVSPDTMNALCSYSWPGNVRELANVIERAIINSHGPVLRINEDLSISAEPNAESSSARTLEQMERDHITRILEDLNWRIDGPRGGARVLGINPSTLRNRMMKLGIHKPNGKNNGNPV